MRTISVCAGLCVLIGAGGWAAPADEPGVRAKPRTGPTIRGKPDDSRTMGDLAGRLLVDPTSEAGLTFEGPGPFRYRFRLGSAGPVLLVAQWLPAVDLQAVLTDEAGGATVLSASGLGTLMATWVVPSVERGPHTYRLTLTQRGEKQNLVGGLRVSSPDNRNEELSPEEIEARIRRLFSLLGDERRRGSPTRGEPLERASQGNLPSSPGGMGGEGGAEGALGPQDSQDPRPWPPSEDDPRYQAYLQMRAHLLNRLHAMYELLSMMLKQFQDMQMKPIQNMR